MSVSGRVARVAGGKLGLGMPFARDSPLPTKYQVFPLSYNNQDMLIIQPNQLPDLQMVPCSAQVDEVHAAIFGKQLQRSCILLANAGLNVVFIPPK